MNSEAMVRTILGIKASLWLVFALLAYGAGVGTGELANSVKRVVRTRQSVLVQEQEFNKCQN